VERWNTFLYKLVIVMLYGYSEIKTKMCS